MFAKNLEHQTWIAGDRELWKVGVRRECLTAHGRGQLLFSHGRWLAHHFAIIYVCGKLQSSTLNRRRSWAGPDRGPPGEPPGISPGAAPFFAGWLARPLPCNRRRPLLDRVPAAGG